MLKTVKTEYLLWWLALGLFLASVLVSFAGIHDNDSHKKAVSCKEVPANTKGLVVKP